MARVVDAGSLATEGEDGGAALAGLLERLVAAVLFDEVAYDLRAFELLREQEAVGLDYVNKAHSWLVVEGADNFHL